MANTIPVSISPAIDRSGLNSTSRSLDQLTSTRNVRILAQVDAKNLLRAEKSLGVISTHATEFEKSMEAANARVLAFGTSVAVIEGMRRSFLYLIKTTVDVENALTKIESVSKNSLSNAGITIEQYGKQLFKVARETGQTFETVSGAALEFARQGLGLQEQLKRTKDALILTRLSGLDSVASVEALTAAYNTFKGEVSSTNEILQKLVAVDNASAASMSDLAEGIQRAGFVAKDVGQNINEVIATIAVLQEATARGGSVIGNAFKTIATRAQTLENLKLFEGLGVDTTIEGKVKPTIQLLQELAQIINSPNFTGNKTNILSKLAGNFQINQLSAFVSILNEVNGQTGRYTELVSKAANASNEATKQNERYSQTLAAGLNDANVSIQELFNSIGQLGVKDPFSGLVGIFKNITSTIQDTVDGEGLGSDLARGLIKGIGGVLFSNTGIAIVALALSKVIVNFVKFAKDAAVEFLQFNQTSKEQERLQTSIAGILATERGILDGIANTEQGRVQLAQRVADIYERQLTSALALSQLTKGAAQYNFDQGFRITSEGLRKKGSRASTGFLPSLVQNEMRDVQNGVGGASPNSKIVVMPNFPFGGGKKGLMVANSSEKAIKMGDGYGILNRHQMGERAANGFKYAGGPIRNQTGFADQKSLNAALTLMVNDAILSGKSLRELAAVVNKTIGGFNLVKDSFLKVSKEASIWASTAFKQNQQEQTRQKGFIAGSAAQLNTGGTGFTSSPELSGLGFRRPGKEGPLQGDPFGIANLPQFDQERLQSTKATKARLAIDNDRRRASQQELAAKIKQRAAEKEFLDRTETQRGEAQKRLEEVRPARKGEAKRSSEIEFGGRVMSRNDAAKIQRGEVAYRSAIAKNVRDRVKDLDKDLFENYGYDPTVSSRKPLSQNQRVNQSALKDRLLAAGYSTDGGRPSDGGVSRGIRSPAGGFAGFSQGGALIQGATDEIKQTKKSFADVAGKLFILGAATEGISSAFGGTSDKLAQFTALLLQASAGFFALKELNLLKTDGFSDKVKGAIEGFGQRVTNVGGSGTSNFSRGIRAGRTANDSALNFAEFGESFVDETDEFGNKIFDVKTKKPLKRKVQGALVGSLSGGIGRNIGRATAGIGGLVSGAAGLAGKAVGFLPVIGQFVAGATILYQGLKIFKPDLFESLRVGLGGLTTSAQKSQKEFEELSKEIFDTKGEFVGKSNKEVVLRARQQAKDIEDEIDLKRRGLTVENFDPQKNASKIFEDNVRKRLSIAETDIDKPNSSYILKRDKLNLSDFSQSARENITRSAAELAGQTPKDSRELLFSKGFSVDDVKKLSDDEVRNKVVDLYLREITKGIKGAESFKERGKASDFFASEGGKKYLSEKRESFGDIPEKVLAERMSVLNLSTVDSAKREMSFLIQQQNVRDELTSLEERALNVKLRGLDITAEETFELEKQKKVLAFKEAESSSILKEAQKIFDTSIKKAEETRVGGIPIEELENAKSILKALKDKDSNIDPSSRVAIDLIKEASLNLVGGGNDVFANEQGQIYEDAVKGIKKLNEEKRISLDLDIRNSEEAFRLERARKNQLSIEQAVRGVKSTLTEGRISQKESKISLLDARANFSSSNKAVKDKLATEIFSLKEAVISERINDSAEKLKNNLIDLAKTEKDSSPEAYALEQKKLNDEFAIAKDRLLDEKKALIEIRNEALNTLTAFGELSKLINSFEEGTVSSRAQNLFGNLQATDPSALIGGLINEQAFGQAEGKTGENLVRFLAEQNALLDVQSKKRLAINTEELESLNIQEDLLAKVVEIKNSSLSAAEKQLKLEAAISESVKRGNDGYAKRAELLEISRRSQALDFDAREIARNRRASEFQDESANPNTTDAKRRVLQARQNQESFASLQDRKGQADQSYSEAVENARIAAEKRGVSSPLLESDERFKAARSEAAKTRDNTIAGIKSEEESLKRLSAQLETTESASTSFANSIDQFSRGLGGSRGQNQFNLLQATDPSSIAQGLIGEQAFDSAGNKQGAELVSFLAQQNALLNEQFKIKTAASESERLELERTYELTQQIIAIRNEGLAPIEEQAKIEAAINANLEKRRSFSSGVQDARAGIQDGINNFGADFGRTATEGFRDGLVGAMQAAVSQTDNLRDALLDVALTFANKLRDAALTNLANIITNSVTGGGSGGGGILSSIVGGIGSLFGGARKQAAGGSVRGGSGVKDDVPTLLMGGEYVIPKSTVQEYGKGFFDSLRSGSIGKMAQGGYFAPGVRGQGTISGKENLLDFATQTATSGKGDIISGLGSGAAIASLEPESLRLSNFGRFGDSPIGQATQEAKEQSFGLYVDQLNAEAEYARQQEELKKAKKAQKKSLLTSLAIAAIGAGLSFGLKGGVLGKNPASQTSKIDYLRTNGSLAGYKSVSTGSGFLSGITKGIGSLFGGSKKVSSSSFNGQNDLLPNASGNYNGSTYNNETYNNQTLADALQKELFNSIKTHRNSGGFVSGNGDTIPAMLSNKEFVLNSSAAQKLGDKNLYALNNGASPSSQQGSDERVIAKLDELIEKTIGASNVNVTVSMDSSGKEKSTQSSGDDSQNNQRNLAQKIKETVVNVLREEQRPGGILTRR